MQAAEKAAKERGTVAITIPTGATEVKRRKNRIEFKLAAGTARLAVETIRADLTKNGWNGNAMPLGPMSGSVIVNKKPSKSVSIVYIDTGLESADITISASGTDFKEPKAK